MACTEKSIMVMVQVVGCPTVVITSDQKIQMVWTHQDPFPQRQHVVQSRFERTWSISRRVLISYHVIPSCKSHNFISSSNSVNLFCRVDISYITTAMRWILQAGATCHYQMRKFLVKNATSIHSKIAVLPHWIQNFHPSFSRLMPQIIEINPSLQKRQSNFKYSKQSCATA